MVSGCTSRGAWATNKASTQVRVRPCADRSDTRRCGALFGQTSGQDAVGLFVRAEGVPQRRRPSSEAVEALW